MYHKQIYGLSGHTGLILIIQLIFYIGIYRNRKATKNEVFALVLL